MQNQSVNEMDSANQSGEKGQTNLENAANYSQGIR